MHCIHYKDVIGVLWKQVEYVSDEKNMPYRRKERSDDSFLCVTAINLK